MQGYDNTLFIKNMYTLSMFNFQNYYSYKLRKNL